ncbi:hypothetical protein RND81_04G002700 [Saponaria officinalis]|uniref:Phospholipid scramblase n=1 Tax=Saponaria officinalis TaxID=3572 RepID=A0AAW1LBR3_SAPOF
MRGFKSLKQIVRCNKVVMASRKLLPGLIELHYKGFAFDGNPQMGSRLDGSMLVCRRFKHSSPGEPNLDRDFLAKLWLVDKEMAEESERRSEFITKHMVDRYARANVFEQPPVSQSTTGYLAPTSPEEVQIAPLLARSNLLITRDIEWMNLMFGFEQENRYAIVDVCYPHSPVGFIREESNVLLRQFLRLRRPFTAFITDATGNELFREIGVVHQRWHLWRRIYDLYLENKQFAVVENPGLWCWTFTLKDANGDTLAQVDRDWRGFGFEIFTDAGQYVIRFGSSDPALKTGPAKEVEDLEVVRPLTLSERAVALALAVSLDNDYFSRHGGWGIPFVAVAE